MNEQLSNDDINSLNITEEALCSAAEIEKGTFQNGIKVLSEMDAVPNSFKSDS